MELKPKIALINLGCSKNIVDSEIMLGMLNNAGHDVSLDSDKADIVIINTCSFIQKAEAESVKTIMDQVSNNKKIIIVGCLAQKYEHQLLELIPEVSAIVGTSEIDKIVDVVNNVVNSSKTQHSFVSKDIKFIQPDDTERFHITMGPYSYIKISEGCNWQCSYCLIPELKGKYRSRKIESIVREAEQLAKNGVSEIIIIAQDTTSYGIDLYKKYALTDLLKALEQIDDIKWIRLMYTYPTGINDELIEFISGSKKVVKYLDIPLQHAHPEILMAMNRPALDLENLINKIRSKIPEISIRTCFIVGFPGETEEHFEYLYNFVKKHKFDRLGVFEYSKEKNTLAAKLSNQIKATIKTARRKKLMQLQQNISFEKHQSLIGNIIPFILEEIRSNGMGVGRSYLDAPEVDGLLYVNFVNNYLPGDIIPVKIEKVTAYDLYGVIDN